MAGDMRHCIFILDNEAKGVLVKWKKKKKSLFSSHSGFIHTQFKLWGQQLDSRGTVKIAYYYYIILQPLYSKNLNRELKIYLVNNLYLLLMDKIILAYSFMYLMRCFFLGFHGMFGSTE